MQQKHFILQDSSVSPKSRKKEGGGGGHTTFPRHQSKINIPMTTSKETKLGKGGGGEHPGTPFRGNTGTPKPV